MLTFKILTPSERWAPTQDQMDAFQNAYEKLLPPLVYKIRLAVAKWKDEDYKGASETSKALINFWFNQEHLIGQNIKVTKDKNGIIGGKPRFQKLT